MDRKGGTGLLYRHRLFFFFFFFIIALASLMGSIIMSFRSKRFQDHFHRVLHCFRRNAKPRICTFTYLFASTFIHALLFLSLALQCFDTSRAAFRAGIFSSDISITGVFCLFFFYPPLYIHTSVTDKTLYTRKFLFSLPHSFMLSVLRG